MRRKKFSNKASTIPDVKSVLNDLSDRFNLSIAVLKGKAINYYFEILDSLNPVFKEFVKISDLTEGILYVKVSNSSIRNELFMFNNYILKTVNDKMGSRFINKIVLVS
ncbi:MAG: DUF721 domain-containing protein [Candidatus Delongbacteria bacterium]|nr:DUF721 domain-containing protein [Candidatus Delongbacteria bacterium]MBN2834809.1 DUF721 domain-containing protein [Candidatus Delongbacteria bacterium]